MSQRSSLLDIRRLYDTFDTPLTSLDCGAKCAPYNPSGKPFCCDPDWAVPAVYRSEWDYLREYADLWHPWPEPLNSQDAAGREALLAETPDHMLLLACRGPAHCQRPYRALSCRQFPFFPYITASGRFLGLAYDWEFEGLCWVISHLEVVSSDYRMTFVQIYDDLLYSQRGEYDSYANRSEDMRAHFLGQRRRIPILHRHGGLYLLSPGSERIQPVPPRRLPRFGPYKAE